MALFVVVVSVGSRDSVLCCMLCCPSSALVYLTFSIYSHVELVKVGYVAELFHSINHSWRQLEQGYEAVVHPLVFALLSVCGVGTVEGARLFWSCA